MAPAETQPSDSNIPLGVSLSPYVHMALTGTMGHRHQYIPQLWLDHEPRHGLGNSWDPDVTMALVDSAGSSDQHGPSCNIALKPQHGPKCQPSSWKSTIDSNRSLEH